MTTSHSARQTTALHIAVSGFLALVVAMGIGRFAFTPQVPLMIDEHQLDLTTAGIVAAWNYLGYLAGSFDAMRAKRGIELRLWTGLWGAVIITLLSAVISGAVLHSIARFFIGWASGWTLVLAAAWTNDALAKLNRPALSVAVYGGTGTGILLCGLAAIGIQGLSLTASQGWWIYGAAALLFSLYVSRYLPRPGELSSSSSPHSKPRMTPKIRRLLWSYALAGIRDSGSRRYRGRDCHAAFFHAAAAAGNHSLGTGSGYSGGRNHARDQWSGSQCFSGRRRPDGCGPAGIPVRTRTGTGARPLYGRIADYLVCRRAARRPAGILCLCVFYR